jgi:hypothetical protein
VKRERMKVETSKERNRVRKKKKIGSKENDLTVSNSFEIFKFAGKCNFSLKL